jgi:hypothetical protein
MLLTPQAQNPIDLGGRKLPESIDITTDATATLLADPNVGYGFAVLASMPFFAKRAIQIAEAARDSGKPVVTALTVGALADEARQELSKRGIFHVDSFEDGLRVLVLLAENDRRPGLVDDAPVRPADLPIDLRLQRVARRPADRERGQEADRSLRRGRRPRDACSFARGRGRGRRRTGLSDRAESLVSRSRPQE